MCETLTDKTLGFEITFAPELAALSASSPGDRPDTSATWDSADAPGAAITTPALVTAKSPSPIDRFSPKPSKNEKKRFSFLKRTSVQDGQGNAGFTALPKVNGRPSVESGAAPSSPRIAQTNGNGNLHDRSGAMSPASISNEDKLQKYFGISESQYRVASPEPDLRQRHARIASNQVAPPSAPATGQYNATIVHASPPLPQHEPDRPSTRQSNRSTQDTVGATSGGGSSIGSRVGSVKKRLSILGIGKKASKSSVRSRGQPESLIEE